MNHGYASPPGLLRAHPELKARVRSFVLDAIRGRMASPSASVSLEHPQIVTNLQSEVFTTVPGLRSGAVANTYLNLAFRRHGLYSCDEPDKAQ
jgi:hypothetical protein